MVVAHAAVLAETGEHAIVVIDDQAGARLATVEKQRPTRLAKLSFGHARSAVSPWA
jgi:hypothetical protein